MTDAIVDRTTVLVPPKSRSRGRSARAAAIFGLSVLAAVGAARYGYDWWTVGRFIETTDDAYVSGNATPIAPHIAGFVAAIPVKDNQFVRAGQIIVRLDDSDARAAFDRAQAALAGQRAALAALRTKYVLQQLTIQQAGADLTAKNAQAAFTNEDALRYRSLALTNFGSKQEAQKSWAADEQAQSAVAVSQAELAAAKEQLTELDSEIAQASAGVAQAQAQLQTARLDLGYAEIRSPIDGYVGNRAAEVGAYVTAGAYLLTVIPSAGLWVDANFKEDQLERMIPGQEATLVADAAPDRVLRGRVVSLAPASGAVFSVIPAENATGNFTKIVQRVPVRILLDAKDAALGLIRPGLSITASVDTRSTEAGAP
jgi:membrane fusion protein, multidrug efflux system